MHYRPRLKFLSNGLLLLLLILNSTAVCPAIADPPDATPALTAPSATDSVAPSVDVLSGSFKKTKNDLGLAELKNYISLDLKTSQSRLFYIPDRIIRTSVANVAIAEPVVLAENQICLLGKLPV